jgi:hypothetical protein
MILFLKYIVNFMGDYYKNEVYAQKKKKSKKTN